MRLLTGYVWSDPIALAIFMPIIEEEFTEAVCNTLDNYSAIVLQITDAIENSHLYTIVMSWIILKKLHLVRPRCPYRYSI